MKNLISGFPLLLLAEASNAQSKEDQQAARTLPQAFCDAWAKHDGRELAKIMADGLWSSGRIRTRFWEYRRSSRTSRHP